MPKNKKLNVKLLAKDLLTARAGLTVRQVSEKTGLNLQVIYKIEAGEESAARIQVDTLVAICNFIDEPIQKYS